MSKIWFGNAEKMMWVKCPSTNIQRGRGKWESSGGFLNGGAYVKSSPMSHRKYSIDWNLMESYEAAKIMSFYEGVYGQSPIQFVDPFAAKSNILPLHWSTPRLCAEGGAPSLTNAVPAKAGGTASTLEGSPTGGAFFPADASMSQTITIPVPPGKNLYVGAQGGTSTVLRTNEARNPGPKYAAGTQVYAQNLIANPSFAVDTSGLASGSGINYLLTSPGETPAVANRLSVFGSNPAQAWSLNYLNTTLDYTPVAGQWVAFSARMRRSGSVGLHFSLALQFRNGGTQVSATPYAFVPLTADSLLASSTLYTVVAQVPAGADNARVLMNFGSTTGGGTPVNGWAAHSSEWIACAAPTEAEALAQVANYFDGSTTFDTSLTPAWSGTPHASSSTLTGTLPANWYPPNSNTFQHVAGGASILRVRSRGNNAATYVDPYLNTQPVTGQWVAMGVDVWAYNTTTANNMALQIPLYNGATGTGPQGKQTPIPVGRWTRLTHVRQITDAGTGALTVRCLVWPSTSPDNYFAVRNYVVAYAATEAEALAAVATPFSGDTPATADGRQYSWSASTPNGNAASIESAGPIRSVSGGHGLKVKTEGATTYTSIPYTNSQAAPMVFQNPGVCTLAYTGGMLTSAVATIGTKPPRQDIFRQGEGNTGLKFVGEPTRTGYSSAMDLESVSAEFVETGAWE